MRVIAGLAKGHPLRAPKGTGTRPTSDRAKEALFSSLQPALPGAKVLDLFAGSGALGIEALSRGAAHATFVDRDRHARAAIDANLATTRLAERATVLGRDVARALAELAGEESSFDLVLADPPYDLGKDAVMAVLEGIVAVTEPGAQVRLEQSSRRGGTVAWPAGLTHTGTRRYGDTLILEADRVAIPPP